jgi:TonB family protein
MLTTQEPTKVVVPAQAAGRERCTLAEECPTRLTCELARECLPQDGPDPNAKFAWANAICALFAVIGVIGIFQPLFVLPVKATAKLDIVPVLFNPPPPSPPAAQATPNNTAAAQNDLSEPVETPTIIPAVTPMSAQVTFAVPVEGPVRLVAAQYAAPPPAKLKQPAAPPTDGTPGGTGSNAGAPEVFDSTLGDGGSYPRPERYPQLAMQRNWQGKVMLDVFVDVRGNPASVNVAESSGYRILDNDALEWVKQNWHFPIGRERRYLVPFVYKLKQK